MKSPLDPPSDQLGFPLVIDCSLPCYFKHLSLPLLEVFFSLPNAANRESVFFFLTPTGRLPSEKVIDLTFVPAVFPFRPCRLPSSDWPFFLSEDASSVQLAL